MNLFLVGRDPVAGRDSFEARTERRDAFRPLVIPAGLTARQAATIANMTEFADETVQRFSRLAPSESTVKVFLELMLVATAMLTLAFI